MDQFHPICSGNVRDVEKLSDLLDVIVLNLTEAGREEELGNERLYTKVQKKMGESVLADYRRWLFNKHKLETVQSMRQWLIRETEFLTIAAEAIKGLGPPKDNRQQHHSSIFVENQQRHQKKSRQKCPQCKEQHPIWRCNQFKSLDVKNRWVGYQPKRTDSAIDVWVQIIWEIVVSKKENVTLMNRKKQTSQT